MPVKALLFSRDRAMQLDAVLRSFFSHCQDCEPEHVHVLYHAAPGQHARQYQTLKAAYPEVNFTPQKDFRGDVLQLLDPYPAATFAGRIYRALNRLIAAIISFERLPLRYIRGILLRLRTRLLARLFPITADDSFVLFLVDDNIFVRDFSLADAARALGSRPRALGFSLRLGENTTYCYALDKAQARPEFTRLSGGLLKFKWPAAELDFAYPLEVSSSLYRTRDILPLIASRPFTNPNELEYQMAVSAGAFSEKMPFLLCPERSYTFCNPLNVVQNVTPNRAGASLEYTSQRLANLFDQGYRIRVEGYDGFIPQSCHQEVPLKFYPLIVDVG